jgi:ribosome biogenesis GTPase
MELEAYGFSPERAAQVAALGDDSLLAGRVILERRGLCTVATAEGEMQARASGRLRHQAAGPHELPAIGDWVAVEPAGDGSPARIHAVLPRRSKFSRKVAGAKTEEQVVAANIDRLFVVMGLDDDYSLRRIERYMLAAWESGAEPVVVLNKADLHPDPQAARSEVESVAAGIPVLVLSCRERQGLEQLDDYLVTGETVALVGSSGVGKSTLINVLYGNEVSRTGEVSEHDERGRHTTSHRELVRLPAGALLIDNPGIRELQLWSSGEALEVAFADVEELATACRFRDCRHESEPGCAVREAVAGGELDAARLSSYHRMFAELAHLERRQEEGAALEQKRRWRTIHRAARKHKPRQL